MKVSISLSFKIIFSLIIVLILTLSITTYYNVSVQSDQHFNSIQLSAFRSSDFLKKSMHYSMLKNHREDLRESIRNLGNEPGIERVRIYNDVGMIMYSSDSTEVGHQVNKDADACVMCHGPNSSIIRSGTTPDIDRYTRVYQSRHGYRLLGLINPIQNERSCIEADCHAHAPDQTVLGVLDVQMSLQDFDHYISESSTMQIVSAIVTLVAVAVVSAIVILVVIRRPIKKFVDGTQAIGAGDLEHKIILETRDELGELAVSFNNMVDELKDARSELTHWSDTLMEKIEEKTRELKLAQDEILHMEKMASLGKLSASIAHEINNPLSGILTFAKLIRKQIQSGNLSPERIEKIVQEISLIADETRRCGEIVKDLLFFARREDGVHQRVRIDEIIDKSLNLIKHRLDLQQIQLEKSYIQPSPEIVCDASHIQQALMALFVNAIEAMPDGGTLEIRCAELGNDRISIRITDTGTGIAEEHLPHIFEPFFTTKESTSGVGLGLSIAYGIIQNHDGSIRVSSMPNHGTTFSITLPRFIDTAPSNVELTS